MVFLSGNPAAFREDEATSFTTYFVSIDEPIEDVSVNKSIINFDSNRWVKGMGVKDPLQCK